MFESLSKGLRYGYFSREKQKMFLEDLSLLVDDGVPINVAVMTIRKVSEGIIKRVAISITRSIAQGRQLADGMQGWFARPLVEVIRAGEVGGTLAKTLKAASVSVGQQHDAIKCLVSALLYPVLVLMASLGLLVLVCHLVLDSFVAIRPLSQWPQVGQYIYFMGYFIESWSWLVVLCLFLVAYCYCWLLQTFTGPLRSYFDRLPMVNLYCEMLAACLMETLGLLLSNGVILKDALSIMHRESCPYLSWHILKMEMSLSGGKESIAEVLDTRLINKRDIVRLHVVASSRGFEYALMSLGQQAQKRVAKKVVLAGKVAGGLMLVLAAFVVMIIVLGLYSVGNSIIM